MSSKDGSELVNWEDYPTVCFGCKTAIRLAVLLKSRPKCPRCDGPLLERKYVDTWGMEGEAEQIGEYLVCESCNVAWDALDLDSMEPYEEEME